MLRGLWIECSLKLIVSNPYQLLLLLLLWLTYSGWSFLIVGGWVQPQLLVDNLNSNGQRLFRIICTSLSVDQFPSARITGAIARDWVQQSRLIWSISDCAGRISLRGRRHRSVDDSPWKTCKRRRLSRRSGWTWTFTPCRSSCKMSSDRSGFRRTGGESKRFAVNLPTEIMLNCHFWSIADTCSTSRGCCRAASR